MHSGAAIIPAPASTEDVLTGQANVVRKMVIGSGWMVGLRMADRVIGLISMGILARLLLPEQFGLVGLAVLLIGVLELVSEFNFEAALIREPQTSRRHFDTAWTLNVVRGVFMSGGLLALAVPAAAFFKEPAVAEVTRWLALMPVLAAVENIGVVNFRKELQFDKEVIFVLAARVVATTVTITLAFIWRSHWALVAGMITKSLIRSLLSYQMHSFRPRFSLACFNDLFRFSKWMLVNHMVLGLGARLPAMTIGRITGAEAVAFFNISHEISHLGTTDLGAPIRRALFPGFAKMAADRTQLIETFKHSFGIMIMLSLPIPIGIGLTAPYIIRLFLGPNWMDVVPVLQVLAVFGVVMTLATSNQVIYMAMNRPRVLAILSLLQLCILMPLLLWWVPASGAEGAAWALVVSSVVGVGVDYAVILRILNIHLLELLRISWRALTAAGIMTAVVAHTMSHLALHQSIQVTLLQFSLCVTVGVVSYVVTLSVLWWVTGKQPGPEKQFLDIAWRNRSH